MTPCFLTSSLQNCASLSCCCFKAPVCATLFQQPWETNTDGETSAPGDNLSEEKRREERRGIEGRRGEGKEF